LDGIIEPMELATFPTGRESAWITSEPADRKIQQEKMATLRRDVLTSLVAALEPDDLVLGAAIKELKQLPPGCLPCGLQRERLPGVSALGKGAQSWQHSEQAPSIRLMRQAAPASLKQFQRSPRYL
jgi:hypothetical protein